MAASELPDGGESPDPGSDGPAKWFVALACLVLLTEQTAFGIVLVAPALSGLAAKFNTAEIGWTITLFMLVGGVLTPVVGRLADRYGKRLVLLVLTGICVLGSALCAMASSYGVFLVGRAMMGASVTFLPVAYALIRDVFPHKYRAISMGIATNGMGVATVGGPFMAGILIDRIGVAAVFWFVAAISLVGGLGTYFLVPESPIRNRAKIDYIGAGGVVVSMLLLMYGISMIRDWSLVDARTLTTIGGGLVVGVLWWAYQARTSEPFIDVSVLATRSVAAVVAVYALVMATISVLASYLPLMLETPRVPEISYGFGLSATEVAFYVMPAGLLTIAGGVVVGLLTNRLGYRFFLILGALLNGLGAVILGTLTTAFWMPILGYAIMGMGGVIFAAGPGKLMVVSPTAIRGTVAGVMGAFGALVSALVTQIGGLILSANLIKTVTGGTPVYSDQSFFLLFMVAAAVSAVAFLIAFTVPRAHAEV